MRRDVGSLLIFLGLILSFLGAIILLIGEGFSGFFFVFPFPFFFFGDLSGFSTWFLFLVYITVFSLILFSFFSYWRFFKHGFIERVPEEGLIKVCPRCGTHLPINARYCWNCGLELSDFEEGVV
ncbi:MAG: hypothetical protein ACTSR0_01285 [Candidatus Asgardarchaeia archaeon]